MVRQLADLEEYGKPSTCKYAPKDKPPFETERVPVFADNHHNCKVCYDNKKKEKKVFSFCNAPQC